MVQFFSLAQNLAKGAFLAPLLMAVSVVQAEPAFEAGPDLFESPALEGEPWIGLEGKPWFEPVEDPIAWLEGIPDEPLDEGVSTDWLCGPGCEELWSDLPMEEGWLYASLPPSAVMRGLGMTESVVATPGPLPVIGALAGWHAARRLRRRSRAGRG